MFQILAADTGQGATGLEHVSKWKLGGELLLCSICPWPGEKTLETCLKFFVLRQSNGELAQFGRHGLVVGTSCSHSHSCPHDNSNVFEALSAGALPRPSLLNSSNAGDSCDCFVESGAGESPVCAQKFVVRTAVVYFDVGYGDILGDYELDNDAMRTLLHEQRFLERALLFGLCLV